MKIVSNFANRLKVAMKYRNVKAFEISKATGISKANISSYLSGRYEPKQKNIYLIANFLNVNEAWLIGYDCNMDKFNSALNDIKTRLFEKINDMTEEQLNKTLTFIDDYILK